MDDMLVAIGATAEAAALFFRELIQNGFTREEALTPTQTLIASTMTQTTTGNK